MIHLVPKIMIYRVGKYTPYKGPSQEIEIMLKIINNQDEDIQVEFEEYDDTSITNPQEAVDELINIDKIEVAMRLNATIDLPKAAIKFSRKDMIDKNAQGTVVGENVTDKRSHEELVQHCTNPVDI